MPYEKIKGDSGKHVSGDLSTFKKYFDVDFIEMSTSPPTEFDKMNIRSVYIMPMMDLSFQRLVSAACGAGFVILCESEYLCWKLFKQKNMFFLACQLAILSSAVESALTSLIFFIPGLRILSMFIVELLIRFIMQASYPIMMLFRLRIICYVHLIFMLIPIFQAALWVGLRCFLVDWYLTRNDHDYRIYSIIQPIATVMFTIQNIAINVFFIILAKKKFENTIHVKNVIIINIIVILLECVVVTTEFLFLTTWDLISTVAQIKVRLELSVLVYIVEPHIPQI